MPWNTVSVSNPVPGSSSKEHVSVSVAAWIWRPSWYRTMRRVKRDTARYATSGQKGQAQQRQLRLRPSSWLRSRRKSGRARTSASRSSAPYWTIRSVPARRSTHRLPQRDGILPRCTAGWSSIGATAGSPSSCQQSVACVRGSLGWIPMWRPSCRPRSRRCISVHRSDRWHTPPTRSCAAVATLPSHSHTPQQCAGGSGPSRRKRPYDAVKVAKRCGTSMHRCTGSFLTPPGHLPWCRSITRWSI